MNSVRQSAANGLPIYAECGGLIYLCRSLKLDTSEYPMAGLFDLDLQMHDKPVGHGYVEAEVEGDNPYFPRGAVIRGHEFHYTGPYSGATPPHCLALRRGVGAGDSCDGLVYKQVMASYLHVHADGVPGWAPAFVEAAVKYRAQRLGYSGGENIKGAGASLNVA
jgi:cobyrinic acid a,c-diamide synthase